MTRGDTGGTILIIEDNVDAADSLAMLLRLLGHRIDVARSGDEGLEAAIATRPNAILLYIGMPGLNGYDVASRLRATGEFDDVLIIAVTGFGTESDRRRSREAGIDHHLVKPYDVVGLVKLLGGPSAV